MTATIKITTHYQVSLTERERMPRGLDEHSYKHRPDYMQKRTWSQTNGQKDARFGKMRANGTVPGWLMPKSLSGMIATATATIWGYCGAMSDMPEY